MPMPALLSETQSMFTVLPLRLTSNWLNTPYTP